jgi:nickel-dependent lactate racemase
LVKTLHPIGSISASISLGHDRRVRLERTTKTAMKRAQPPDPLAATMRALAEPIDFPPLASAVVPGDRIAISVDESVPCVGGIVHGVVSSLRGAGIEDEAIAVVTRDAATSELCRTELATHGTTSVQLAVHDPDDESDLCLVGVTKRHGPLVVNRTIFDADVILPIGCSRLNGHGVFDSLFPRFSSAEAVQRYRMPSSCDSESSCADKSRETDEAGWLIGVPIVIEVVPGANESVAHVVAGEPRSVARRAKQLCREEWAFHSPRRASLIIATLSGGAPAQNWSNVGRALVAAERVAAEDGAVVICSNLDVRPGESLGRLIGSTDLAATERRLLRDHAEDSWPAWQLVRALQRGPVYFLSQLDSETVEDLGLAPVANVEELARLASRHESVIVLEDSQHAVVTVDGEEDDS